MPSAGERISSKQVEVKAREFPTRQPGERDFQILGKTATAKQPNDGGATYVTFQMKPLNLEEGEPNGMAFPSFYLDTAPNSTGAVSYESPNGCMAFAQALGDELEVGTVEQEVHYTGKKLGKKGVDTETLTILDPEEVIAFIQAHDGATVRAYEGLKKVSEKDKAANPTWKDQNTIDRWVLPEGDSGLPGLPAR